MAVEHQVTLNSEELESAAVEFFIYYGNAMSQWSRVERGLFWWFAGLTGLKGPMARSIFYSIRSFNSRVEVLEAVIDTTDKLQEFEREFIKQAIKKARQFAGFRNAIAHGEPILAISDPPTPPTYQIVKAKTLDSSDGEPGISTDDLENAAINFVTLGRAVIRMHPRNRAKFETTPQEYLAQVLALPNEANFQSVPTAEGQSPPAEGPSLKNKKAYRAAREAAKRSRPEAE